MKIGCVTLLDKEIAGFSEQMDSDVKVLVIYLKGGKDIIFRTDEKESYRGLNDFQYKSAVDTLNILLREDSKDANQR